MDENPENLNLYTIKCQHCGEQAVVTPLNWITLSCGFILLKGEKDGYIGTTCPNPECLHTTLAKESLETLQHLREELFEEAEYGPGYVKPLLRYRSFPYGFDYPSELAQHRLDSHRKGIDSTPRSMAEDEATHVLIRNDRIDFSGLYCPYAFDDLAMGPMMYVPWFRREGIEVIAKYENETKKRVFPRYMPYDKAMCEIDTFCDAHFMREIEIEEIRDALPGLTLVGEDSLSRSHREADRSHAFFQILTTHTGQTRKLYEMLRSGTEDSEEDHAPADSMEHQVAAYYNRGHGKEFLERKYLDFIQEYMSISGRVGFTTQAVETLRSDYLAQLNQQMRTEFLATKQYAFYEEPPTWTIIFDGKRIPNLTGIGFKYIHYLVANMRQQFSVYELAKLTSDPDISSGPPDRNTEAGEGVRESVKRKDVQRTPDEKFLEQLETRLDILDEQIDPAKQVSDPYTNKGELESERESILAEISTVKSRILYPKGEDGEAKRLKDRITKRIERAVNEIMKWNEKAGKHFEEALRPINSLQQRYNPSEDIPWHIE